MSFETSHIRALPSGKAASLRGTLLPAPAGTGIGSEALGSFLVWLKIWLVVASSCGLRSGRNISGTQRYIKTVLEGVLTNVFPHFKKANEQKGYQRPPSLLPDGSRAAIAPQVLCGRRRRRILSRLNGRGVPASRRYDGLQYLNDRQLTGNQFLERACRLSVNGRVGIYGLEYRLRLCQRRHEIIKIGGANPCAYSPFALSGTPHRKRVSFGLSAFHLGPD